MRTGTLDFCRSSRTALWEVADVSSPNRKLRREPGIADERHYGKVGTRPAATKSDGAPTNPPH